MSEALKYVLNVESCTSFFPCYFFSRSFPFCFHGSSFFYFAFVITATATPGESIKLSCARPQVTTAGKFNSPRPSFECFRVKVEDPCQFRWRQRHHLDGCSRTGVVAAVCEQATPSTWLNLLATLVALGLTIIPSVLIFLEKTRFASVCIASVNYPVEHNRWV